MNREEEIRQAANTLFKDSEYPVPNIYSFMKGAEWADKFPKPAWVSMAESQPANEEAVLVAVVHSDFKVMSYEVILYNPLKYPAKDDNIFWMPIPELPDELVRRLF